MIELRRAGFAGILRPNEKHNDVYEAVKMQSTVARSITFEGVGLHGGQRARMSIRPAAAGTGVRFQRVDVTDRDQIVPARWDRVSDTRLCTRLSNVDGVSVSTVEHLMAALAGMGVDNALIEIDGPEIPIMDGSAAPFVGELRRVGLVSLGASRQVIRILERIEVECGGARATLSPADADALEIAFRIEFPEPAIGVQEAEFTLAPGAFARDLADCRTFCRLDEIEALRAAGLARGGNLQNAVVVDGAEVLNPDGLRRADEFVRHKALDAVGDLALAGAEIRGRYEGLRAGHGPTNQLLRALFARPEAWRFEDEPVFAVAAQ